MCRLPAGQTTFAISNSFLPYTCTCCEINYAFSSCQARKRALLSKWVGGRKTWKGAQGGADGENPSVFPVQSLKFGPVVSKNNAPVSARCQLFSIEKIWIHIHPFVPPARGDISLFNPSRCCLQPTRVTSPALCVAQSPL